MKVQLVYQSIAVPVIECPILQVHESQLAISTDKVKYTLDICEQNIEAIISFVITRAIEFLFLLTYLPVIITFHISIQY